VDGPEEPRTHRTRAALVVTAAALVAGGIGFGVGRASHSSESTPTPQRLGPFVAQTLQVTLVRQSIEPPNGCSGVDGGYLVQVADTQGNVLGQAVTPSSGMREDLFWPESPTYQRTGACTLTVSIAVAPSDAYQIVVSNGLAYSARTGFINLADLEHLGWKVAVCEDSCGGDTMNTG